MISFLTREQTWLRPSKKNCSSLFFTAKHVFFFSFQVNRIQELKSSWMFCGSSSGCLSCGFSPGLSDSFVLAGTSVCHLSKLAWKLSKASRRYWWKEWCFPLKSQSTWLRAKPDGSGNVKRIRIIPLFMIQANIVSCQSFRVYMQMFECCFT